MNNVSYFNFRNPKTSTNSIRNSLVVLNKLSRNLLEVLDRKPSHLPRNVISLTKQTQEQGSFLLVDEVIRLTKLMNIHLDDILRHVDEIGLNIADYVVELSSGNKISLVEALQDKRNIIVHRRNTDNFLNQTFGSVLDEIQSKIQKIINRLPQKVQVELKRAA